MTVTARGPVIGCTFNQVEKPLTAEERRRAFYDQKLQQVRDSVGIKNQDQELKEELLTQLIVKIASVAIGSLEKVEQAFGAEVWGYKVPSEIYHQFSDEERKTLRRRAKIWGDTRTAIINAGEKQIAEVLDMFCDIIFVQREQSEKAQKKLEGLWEQITHLTKENLRLTNERTD